MAHRGPDDHGIFLAPGVGLAHRRLSIVDLSGGHQPMPNEDDRVWITFNGEIYNHLDLRPGLERDGHRYRTASDTETIVHLYEDRGPEAFERLLGMFAFGIWDAPRRTLTLARDHSGIKPLYYAATPEGDLVFASEVKALFASGLFRAELDSDSIPEFFATGHVSGDRTLLRGIRKLPPGHWLTWRDGTIRVARFWTLREAAADNAGEPAPQNMEEAASAFWHRFVTAVRSQLMSDVPLGAFLSGGLDSSLIVAAMRALEVPTIETFAVGYADPEANELPFARTVASRFETRHHEVSLTADDFLAAIPRLTWQRDFPLSFEASIPLAAVAEVARSHVKVVLTGEGSDELFAGYGRYRRALINLTWGRRLDRWLPSTARALLRAMTDHLGHGYVGSRVRRSFIGQEGNAIGAFLEPFSEFGRLDRARLLGATADPFGPLTKLIDEDLLGRNPLEAFLRLDQETYLEELLMKQDTMSMAASIESRVPFLDHTLRVWAARLPPTMKLQGWTGKAVVRAAANSHLPPEVIHAKKRGFPVPIARWLREPAGSGLLDAYVLTDLTEAGLRNEFPRKLVSEHRDGRDHSRKLWRLLAFAVWLRETLPRLSAVGRESSSRAVA
jgi:asparagine synthase (glutamine-hydrolysing)